MTKLLSAIHPTAIIEDSNNCKSCKIGPYCCVGSDVTLDDSVILESHIVISEKTFIGKGTKIWPFALVGSEPQDQNTLVKKQHLQLAKII